jgi:hypothetical protein
LAASGLGGVGFNAYIAEMAQIGQTVLQFGFLMLLDLKGFSRVTLNKDCKHMKVKTSTGRLKPPPTSPFSAPFVPCAS